MVFIESRVSIFHNFHHQSTYQDGAFQPPKKQSQKRVKYFHLSKSYSSYPSYPRSKAGQLIGVVVGKLYVCNRWFNRWRLLLKTNRCSIIFQWVFIFQSSFFSFEFCLAPNGSSSFGIFLQTMFETTPGGNTQIRRCVSIGGILPIFSPWSLGEMIQFDFRTFSDSWVGSTTIFPCKDLEPSTWNSHL